MTEQENNELEYLRDVLLKCFRPSLIPNEEYKEKLKSSLKIWWNNLATNNFCDRNEYLLTSKVAVKATEYLVKPKQNFYGILNNAFESENLEIRDIDLYISIKHTANFRYAVTYGFINSFDKNDTEYRSEYRFIYNHIIANSVKSSQAYHYRQLLIQYVNKFCENLSPQDIKNIFCLFYYTWNVATLHTTLLSDLLNRSNVLNVNNIVTTTLNSMSWKYKQKYLILLGMVKNRESIVTTLPHDEVAKGIVYSQSIPYLTQLGALLYGQIIKNLDDEVWKSIYFTAFDKIIGHEENTTLCARNILQHLLCPEYLSRDRYKYVWEKSKNSNIYTYLCVMKLGLKMGIEEPEFNDETKINNGIDCINCNIRAIYFDIMCLHKSVESESTYNLFKHYIQLNINDAESTLRDSFIKSYKIFLMKVEYSICASDNISKNNLVVQYSANFFNWLIPFLLDQFNQYSNYQRTSLSLAFLHTTLTSFCKNKKLKGKKLIMYKEYMSYVNVFNTLDKYFLKFLNMLEICHVEHRDKIISLIVSEIYTSKDNDKLHGIEENGFVYLNSPNQDTNMKGIKILILLNNIDTDGRNKRYERLKISMYNQWSELKFSTLESVVENNPLYPTLSMINSFIHLTKEDAEEVLSFVEDVVSKLLIVFALRSLRELEDESYCVGITKSFRSEQSQYHKITVNCMWLVLKECCKLCAEIIQVLRTEPVMNRVLEMLNSIIKKCFHKGALEVAGDMLAHIVSSATKEGYCVTVIDDFLCKVLQSLPEVNTATSTVRRAAETRVVLSAIAVNDRRLFKPLFHMTMRCMISSLELCLKYKDDSSYTAFHSLILHCLHPIIINKLIEVDILDYVTQIFMLALRSFSGAKWKIYNATLQTYSALSNKILGTVLSSTESSQEHYVCLEETFFCYPEIYDHIMFVLSNHERFNYMIPPLMSFISMSFKRNDELIICTKMQVDELKFAYLKYQAQLVNKPFPSYILATNAYKSLCAYSDIHKEIQDISESMIYDTANMFYALYKVKILTDKLYDDIETIPKNNDILKITNEQVNFFTNKLLCNDTGCTSKLINTTYFKSMCSVLLRNFEFKTISINEIVYNSTYLATNYEIFPGLWDFIIININLALLNGDTVKNIELLKCCFNSNIPLNVKISVLSCIKNRIIENPQCLIDYDAELILTLLSIISNDKYHNMKKIMDDSVNILLLLLNVRDDTNNLIDIENINKNIPTHLLPVMSCILSTTDPINVKIRNFFEYVTQKCLENFTNENPDILIYHSIRFICKYAKMSKNDRLLRDTFKIIYKILQRDETEFRELSIEIFKHCFNQKPKHTYAYMLHLLQKEFLLDHINSYYTFQFLTEIFCERNDRIYSLAAFDDKQVVAIDTHIVADIIFNILKSIYIDVENHSKIVNWFNEYNTQNQNNEYVMILKEKLCQIM